MRSEAVRREAERGGDVSVSYVRGAHRSPLIRSQVQRYDIPLAECELW